MLPLFLVLQLCLYLGNSKLSVYRTIGPLVYKLGENGNITLLMVLFLFDLSSNKAGQISLISLEFTEISPFLIRFWPLR